MAKKGGGRRIGKAQSKRSRQIVARPVAQAVAPPAGQVSEQSRTETRPPAAERPVVSNRTATPALRRAVSPLSTTQTDYSYVRQDLRRIGILTGTIIAILVILTFFLR